MGKTVAYKKRILNQLSASGTYTSDTYYVSTLDNIGIQINGEVVSGTPTGTFYVMDSVDEINYTPILFASLTGQTTTVTITGGQLDEPARVRITQIDFRCNHRKRLPW